MGRREEPIDPRAGSVQRFAADLRKLREAAGTPSYRALAAGAHFSASALSAAARGRLLPTWPVVRGFVIACGGDEGEWRDRWLEAAASLPDTAPAEAAGSAGPASTAAFTRVDPSAAPRSPATGAPSSAHDNGRSTRQWRGRYLISVLAAAITTAVVAAVLWPAPKASSGLVPSPPAPAPGSDCAPGGIIAPTVSSTPPQNSRTRMDFEPGGLIWGPYWGNNNVHEDLVRDHPYQGRSSLEVHVGLGIGAFGTVHVDGLKPGATVSLQLWYGGQGQGIACPFVQDPGYTIEWVPMAPVVLAATTRPGWRTVHWRMPDVPVHGVGLQLNNTGLNDLVIRLDAVNW